MTAPSRQPAPRVCAAVVSHLPHDARVQKEARTLAARGFDVTVIGLRYGIDEPLERLDHGVRIVELPFGERGERSLRQRAAILLRVWARIVRTPAETYHCHNVHVAIAVLVAATLRRARIVYDAHELYGEVKPGAGIGSRLSAHLSRLVERLVVRRAATVITTNSFRARVLAERYPRASIEVVANVPATVGDAELRPLDPGFPAGRRILLYQGGIYAEARAFRATIEALAQLEGVDLAVLGFGRDRDLQLLRRWAQEAGVGERLHIYPARPFEQLVRISAAADLGIVPLRRISENSYLGDTNKLFEYLMAGLPVVGSAFPEISRVLAEGSPSVGECFDPEDPSSIAAAVRTVLADGYAERSREARRLALEHYSWEQEAATLARSYPI